MGRAMRNSFIVKIGIGLLGSAVVVACGGGGGGNGGGGGGGISAGDYVLFDALISGNRDVYRYNTSDGTTERITTSVDDDRNATMFLSRPNASQSWIAYVNAPPGNDDIWIVRFDGQSPTQLTTNAQQETQPAFDRTGGRITYMRQGAIWMMNSDGTGQTNVSNGVLDQNPVFRPATSGPDVEIWFDRFDVGTQASQLFKMTTGGAGITQVTNTNLASNVNVAFSPDGTQVVFQSNRDGNQEIYKMNVNGTGLVNLTNRAANDYAPSWSPSGYIYFESDEGSAGFRIWRMNADGTNKIVLGSTSNTSAVNAFGK